MKVLVTGGKGFIGGSVAGRLIELGYQVKTLSRSPSSSHIGNKSDHYQIDLTKKIFDSHFLDGVDVVFHIAAKAGIDGHFKEYYNANFIATQNILHACKKRGVKYFIYTSSPSVVFSKAAIRNGNETPPYTNVHISSYASTKAMAEKEVLNSNNGSSFCTIALRPHLVWGNGDPHLLPKVIKRHLQHKLKIVGDGENKVDLTHIDNVTHAHVSAMNSLINSKDLGGKAYFISQNEPVSLWPWLNQLFSKLELPPIQKKVSFRKAYLAGQLAEIIWRALNLKSEIPMSRFAACQLSHDHWFSSIRAEKDLGYKPIISMDEALVKTLPSLKKLTINPDCD